MSACCKHGIAKWGCPECYPEPGWQPISTAPEDGTVLWTFNGEQGRMHWTEGETDGGKWALWVWDDLLLDDADPEPDQPTHWMELPAPPVVGTTDGGKGDE